MHPRDARDVHLVARVAGIARRVPRQSQAARGCLDRAQVANGYRAGTTDGLRAPPEDCLGVRHHGCFIHLTSAPNCPAAQSLPADVTQKVEAVEGVKSAEVEIVFDPPWTPDKMAMSAKLVMNIL